MEIRHSKPEDMARIMEIYARARDFMAANGNPHQWGDTHWPPEEIIREDIALGRSFVCTENDKVIGTFCYIFGKDIDPTYAVIEGAWSKDCAYGAVHRIASDGTKGVGSFCIEWALRQSGYLRIDTHADNKIMLNLLRKLGFHQCGIIYVQEDNFPRFAFDKSL